MAHFLRYLIASWVLTLGVSFAQTSKEPEGQKTFTAISLAGSPADVEGLFLLQNKQPTELKLKGNSRSQPMVVSNTAVPLTFVRKGKNSTSEKAVYDTVAQVAWPDAHAKVVLLLISVNPATKAVSILAINDGLDAFPIQTVKAINATRVPLLLKVNTFTGEIAAGGVSQATPYPSLDKAKPNAVMLYPFGVAIKQANAEPLVVSSGNQEAASGSRSLIVILPPVEPNSTKVRTKVIVDRPVVPAASSGRR